MTANQRPRSGVTLMEVMVATGILAIGLVCIMALFPIGAVNMARAITQDRSATHGVNSDEVFRFYWKQAWNDPTNGTYRASNTDAYFNSQEPLLFTLENHPNPNYGVNGNIPTGLSQPSFPVMVDPVGYLTKSGLEQSFIAGSTLMPLRTTLRRCININGGYWLNPVTAAFPNQNPAAPYPSIINAVVRNTTLLDDMTFTRPGDNSTTSLTGETADFTGQIERGGRYTAAWLVYRPRNDFASEANVTVLLYAGRSATDTPSAEVAFPGTVAVPGTKSMIIPIGAQALPPVKRGGWVALHRIVTSTVGQGQVPAFVPYMTFDFYRVTGLNSDNPGTLVLELETNVKLIKGDQVGVAVTGTAVFFDNLVEVFERGTVSATGTTRSC